MDYFKFLPVEITLEILSRVPTESALDCKSVCTNWRNLVSHHPSFSKMHLHHLNHPSDSGKLGFLVVDGNDSFYYFEYNVKITNPIQRIRRVNLSFPSRYTTIVVGSCNGLICFARYRNPSVWICNPITRECFTLPELKRDCIDDVDGYSYGASSFGYVSSSNEYKVVGIYTLETHVEVYAYTLGAGNGWRNLGNFSKFSENVFIPAGRFVNGALYWMDITLGMIVTFDLAEEKFCQHLSPPPLPADNDRRTNKIGVLDGILYFAIGFDIEESGECFDIWLLKKKNGNEGNKEQNDCQSFGWTKEFRVDNYRLLADTNSDGVLTCDHSYVNIYDRKTAASKRLVKFENWLLRALPHKNTLVSLKQLGEGDTEIMESVKIEETIDHQQLQAMLLKAPEA